MKKRKLCSSGFTGVDEVEIGLGDKWVREYVRKVLRTGSRLRVSVGYRTKRGLRGLSTTTVKR